MGIGNEGGGIRRDDDVEVERVERVERVESTDRADRTDGEFDVDNEDAVRGNNMATPGPSPGVRDRAELGELDDVKKQAP